MDFASILEGLKESNKNQKVLLCKPDTFRFLCKLEMRRMERGNGLPVAYTGLLFLVCNDPQLQIEEVMEKFQQVLLGALRRSDVISRWSENQFVLFFPGLDLEGAEKVMQRIEGIFKETFYAGEVSLYSSINPLSPWENI
ncbi:MAG: diguanylate cyclase domain-containing protein [Dethiobacteria bacterium]